MSQAMTPLLQALVAASKVGFDAPKCHLCLGHKTRHEYREPTTYGGAYAYDTGEPCRMCHATGFDVSDPDRLVGRALGWIHDNVIDVTFKWATDEVILFRDIPASALPPGERAPEDSERHNGTAESRAIAILTLIARTGATTSNKETP